ncbi:clasp N terminal-domain-containing protein [Fimicolochytrium jonesii]|uniref:clasp N terminal-domain-containing protein n=1 Tax=Fimicolochytrium jonesii TaxID=1396493 RepID=UPI0022FE6AB6|nr:clasp N terminal-domain-containing protein [Fimicolochytrium jonesii]KAI8816194.1 clasp N terminal-domain-containing protein [Fimicolochytrium jonesii]
MAKGPSNEGIAMPDDAALERELRRIMPSAAEKETEGNWEGRLANFERLTNIVKGSFALPKFIQTIKRVVKEPLSIGLLSDRTRLSRAAMTVVETMGTVLGRNFQALSNDLLKPVLKLTGRTNRIYVNTAVHTIKTCIASGGLPALVEALAESGREPARGQREATADCFAFLMEHNDARSLAPYVDSIEAYIRTAITDASGEVRAYTRSSYETYKCRFPERVDLFHGSLSSVAKKGLKINSSSPLSTKASPARSTKAPPAMKPPVPSTTVSPARPPIRNLVAAAAEHPTKPSFGRVKAEQETASRPRRAVQGPSTETRVGAQRVQRVLRKDDEDTGMNPKKPVGAMRVLARPQTKPELSRVPNSKPALNGRASASRIAKPELKPEINNLRSSVKSYGSKPSLPGTASGISRAAPSPPPLSPPRALPSPPGQLTVPKSPSRLPKPLSPSRLPQPRIVGTVAQPHVHDISLVPSSPETLQNATAPSYSPANGKCLAQPSPKVVSTSTSPSCASQHGKSLVPPSSPKEPCTPSLDALPDVAVGDAPRVASACPPVLQVQGQIPRAASIPGWEAPFVQVDAEHLRVGKNATPDFSADLSFKKINLESIFSPYIVDKPGWVWSMFVCFISPLCLTTHTLVRGIAAGPTRHHDGGITGSQLRRDGSSARQHSGRSRPGMAP